MAGFSHQSITCTITGEKVMIINFKGTAPIGSAFAANSGLIMSSIEQAAAASAAKMGDDASKLFSIETWNLTKQMQKAA
jgi:hypothetical protein